MMNQIKRSYSKFEKYYKKMQQNSVYAAAIILHPNRKIKYIEKNWSRDLQRSAIKSVKELWERYRESDPPGRIITASDDFDFDMSSLAERLDDFDLAAKEVDVDLPSNDEYKTFLAQGNIKITESALDWWLLDAQRTTWPRLSQMAIDVLSIPAMSDEPERVFSGARRTISWERAKLGSLNIERTECLKHWMRADLVSTDDSSD
jgi:hypothetical protein